MATIPEAFAAGLQHHQQGRLAAAEQIYRQILLADPKHAHATHLLGVVAHQVGKHDIAIDCIGRAIALDATIADFHYNLASVHRAVGALAEAIACCRRAVELQPAHTDALNNLGNMLKDQGDLEEGLACYRRALAVNPQHAVARSNYLFALHYSPEASLAALAEAHADYDRIHAAPLAGVGRSRDKDRQHNGPLRLGFVSPDFGRHPIGYLMARVFASLGRISPETICYSDWVRKDDMTLRLQTLVSDWRDVHGMSDEKLAEQIAADRIDILFDLAGHTAHNRLLVFARKPAPVQITWAGYVGTTGLQAMDFLLADHHTIPAGAERHYRERVLRMPDSRVCYDPPAEAPPVSTLPALTNGHVTFGCFNNPAKLNPQVIELWSRILRGAPHSKLILKYKGLGDASIGDRVRRLFDAGGIDAGRLILLDHSTYAEALAAYHRIDLALDPFPFSGGLTTCDALWMGVPVVTCPGETFASRQSLGLLSSVGLTETVARSNDDYVERALTLARDLPRLADIRSRLRSQMASSPLCDGKKFAADFIELLQTACAARVDTPHRVDPGVHPEPR